jgi:hypothetical protein
VTNDDGREGGTRDPGLAPRHKKLEVENVQSKDYYDVQSKTILTIGGESGAKFLTVDNGFQTGVRK